NLLNANDPDNPLKRAITLRDPVSGQLFANNRIPVSRFEAPSLALVKYLPPSAAGSGLAFYSNPDIQNFEEMMCRFDYALGADDRPNFRFNKAWYDQPGIFANSNLLTYADHTPDTSYNTPIQESHIFSPTLLNDFRFGVPREVTSRYPPEGV